MEIDSRTPKNARLRASNAGGILVALGCAALIGACGTSKSSTKSQGKTNLDTARVAHSIEQSILAQRHLLSTVVCPTGVPQEQGRTFECVATTRTTTKPVKVGRT